MTTPSHPSESDNIQELLEALVRKAKFDVRSSFYRQYPDIEQGDAEPGVYLSISEAMPRIQTQLRAAEAAAYERGRIDEAKTCEQAQRHDAKLHEAAGARKLAERLKEYALPESVTKIPMVNVVAIDVELKKLELEAEL